MAAERQILAADFGEPAPIAIELGAPEVLAAELGEPSPIALTIHRRQVLGTPEGDALGAGDDDSAIGA
jgi:hypothetical protein